MDQTVCGDTAAAISVEELKELLRRYADGIDRDPQTNSVFLLSKSVFSKLEAGDLSPADVKAVVDDLHLEHVNERVDRFSEQHGTPTDAWNLVENSLKEKAKEGLETFRRFVETPRGGIVFTAHPTFALSQDFRQTMAEASSTGDHSNLRDAVCAEGIEVDRRLDLMCEHEQVQGALVNARNAIWTLTDLILRVTREAFPNDWKTVRPVPPTLASWVGYDLDGRTDIEWNDSLSFRLAEKAVQLDHYASRFSSFGPDIDHRISDSLARVAQRCREQAQAFVDISAPEALVAAANMITDVSGDDRLVSVEPLLSELDRIIALPTLSDDQIANAICLYTEINTLKLGTGRIHLRLNSAQIRTLIEKDLNLETEEAELGRLALTALAEKAETIDVRDVNFGDLAAERSTARRQFMLCRQLLTHVDSDSPIRFLIAESENPATVMGALYLAQQYGIADKLDISPLFETPEAMETGGRFVERLLEQPVFANYLRSRGYLSLQFGFSDSGRFVGQIAGDLAIERIHSHVGRALANAENLDVGLLLFNTHGESMGRGGYPGTFQERFDHLLTPWNRARYDQWGIKHIHEASFQGGDGFLHFMSPQLAETTVAHFYSHLIESPDDGADDAFYAERDFMWDVYRSLGQWQVNLFQQGDYGVVLNGSASGFLIKAGSRVRRRAGGEAGPRSLRAISHNATLQQLGLPLNTACGLGSAVRTESDRLVDTINRSNRLKRLVALAIRARILLSLPAFRGYGELANPTAWMSFAKQANPKMAAGYRAIASIFEGFEAHIANARVANHVSIDLAKFDSMLAQINDAPSIAERHSIREGLHVLHALRQALMMHAMSLVSRLPTLSNRHAVSVEDMIRNAERLDLRDTVQLLSEIFPLEESTGDVRDQIKEVGHSSYNSANGGYVDIHRDVINPLKQTTEVLYRITLAICQKYGAYG